MPRDRRDEPDLKEVRRLVSDALNSLWITPEPALIACTSFGPSTCCFAHAVLVREPAVEHVGQDLHVAMAVRTEALAGRDAIVVEHAQRAKAHVLRIVVPAERKRVIAVQPPQVALAAVLGLSQCQHVHILTLEVGGSQYLTVNCEP